MKSANPHFALVFKIFSQWLVFHFLWRTTKWYAILQPLEKKLCFGNPREVLGELPILYTIQSNTSANSKKLSRMCKITAK